MISLTPYVLEPFAVVCVSEDALTAELSLRKWRDKEDKDKHMSCRWMTIVLLRLTHLLDSVKLFFVSISVQVVIPL